MKRVRERVGAIDVWRRNLEKNKALSLCGLCAFDVLLVFSWEADNHSLTTSLYHLTGFLG